MIFIYIHHQLSKLYPRCIYLFFYATYRWIYHIWNKEVVGMSSTFLYDYSKRFVHDYSKMFYLHCFHIPWFMSTSSCNMVQVTFLLCIELKHQITTWMKIMKCKALIKRILCNFRLYSVTNIEDCCICCFSFQIFLRTKLSPLEL